MRFLCWLTVALLLRLVTPAIAADGPHVPHFRAVTIDDHIQIGYAVSVADVDGDGRPDVLVVDKKQVVWYRNPSWEKFVIAENLTELDNVCIAAADIDGDGKAEIAVGAGWNPGDTVNSGAVFYLVPPAERTGKWRPVALPHEPTVHRMHWVRNGSGGFDLIVIPLHGRGNRAGQGAGARILRYQIPPNPEAPWKMEVINDSLHLTHNFDVAKWPGSRNDLLVASKEGLFELSRSAPQWRARQLAGNQEGHSGFPGAGEVRNGRLPNGAPFLATVEPMHGDTLACYIPPPTNAPAAFWARKVIYTGLKEGHALACGDLLGTGSDQIVVGWRGRDEQGKVGIFLFRSMDNSGNQWASSAIDDNGMACEDLCLADLNGDGKLDIVASGRATKNVKIYFNQSQ